MAVEGAAGAGDAKPDRVEFLLVTVDDRTRAVEVGRVLRVASDPPVTRVPRSAPPIRGVTSVDGDVRAVVDAGALLGADVSSDNSALVVLDREGKGEPFCLLVDDVVDIEPRAVDELRPPDRVDLPEGDHLFRAALDGDDPVGVFDVEAIASAVSAEREGTTVRA